MMTQKVYDRLRRIVLEEIEAPSYYPTVWEVRRFCLATRKGVATLARETGLPRSVCGRLLNGHNIATHHFDELVANYPELLPENNPKGQRPKVFEIETIREEMCADD